MVIRLLNASWAGFVVAGVGGLKPPVATLPDTLVDKGVFRPEEKGEGVGWRDGKEGNALEVFIGGFFWDVLDGAELDQSMPARSSIFTGDIIGAGMGFVYLVALCAYHMSQILRGVVHMNAGVFG